MDEPITHLAGRDVPARTAALPLWNAAVTAGVAATEALRTFRGVPFRVDDHLDRLFASARGLDVDPPVTRDALGDVVRRVCRHNAPLTERGELRVGVFLSAGPVAAYHPDGRIDGGGPDGPPTVGVHTTPLRADRWAKRYADGVRLVIPATRQIPAACLDPRLKIRSRAHWRVAERQAHAADPDAAALLLHLDGTVAETTTGNVLAVRGDTLLSPPSGGILNGVSRDITRALGESPGLTYREVPLTPADLHAADEVLLTNTPVCLLPVVALDGTPVGGGRPGPAFRSLLAAWVREVGLDFTAG